MYVCITYTYRKYVYVRLNDSINLLQDILDDLFGGNAFQRLLGAAKLATIHQAPVLFRPGKNDAMPVHLARGDVDESGADIVGALDEGETAGELLDVAGGPRRDAAGDGAIHAQEHGDVVDVTGDFGRDVSGGQGTA